MVWIILRAFQKAVTVTLFADRSTLAFSDANSSEDKKTIFATPVCCVEFLFHSRLRNGAEFDRFESWYFSPKNNAQCTKIYIVAVQWRTKTKKIDAALYIFDGSEMIDINFELFGMCWNRH